MYGLLKVLGLRFSVSETQVTVKLGDMYRLYHQDKHKTEQTVMTEEDKTTLF